MKDHTYFVYILASKSRVLYVGITNSVERRTLEHQEETSGFCQRYRTWRLVHYERFQYVNNAIRREKILKGWSRAKKMALIEETNPTWEDLALAFGAPAVLGRCEMQSFGQKADPSSGCRPPLEDKRRLWRRGR